jgi:outer membrane biogenesis lipoprotein LolB
LNTQLLSLSLSILLLSGCAGLSTSTPVQSTSAAPSVDFLGQTQLPVGTKILYEASLIIGSGDNWVGRVMLDVGKDSRAAYSFFLEQYPQQGWTLLTAIRGKTSLLVFTKQDRSATVEMNESTLLSSTLVTLTVTPKNAVVVAPKKP